MTNFTIPVTCPDCGNAFNTCEPDDLGRLAPTAPLTPSRLLSILHGYHTPGHYFARIIDGVMNLPVGTTWFCLDASSGQAYIYYIAVPPEHRRRGYASAAINAVAHLARSKGCVRLALNVFARNEPAQLLYRKLGFLVVSLHMNKPL